MRNADCGIRKPTWTARPTNRTPSSTIETIHEVPSNAVDRASHDRSIPGQARLTDEEYEIYGHVLTRFFRDRNRLIPNDQEKHFVIASRTATTDPDSVTTERSSVYRSFRSRNKKRANLEPQFPVRFSYSLADEQEILDWAAQESAEYRARQEQLRREGRPLDGGPCGPEWKRFNSRFPGSHGYYRLSRIGFSRDHRRAYLEIEGNGATWSELMAYTLKWTTRGWQIQNAGGGGGVC